MVDYVSQLLNSVLNTQGNLGDATNEVINGSQATIPLSSATQTVLSQANPNPIAAPAPQVQIDPVALSKMVLFAQKTAGANRDFENDLTTLSDKDLDQVYGPGSAALRNPMYVEVQNQKSITDAGRSTSQLLGDEINKAAQGAIGFIGGGATLVTAGGNLAGNALVPDGQPAPTIVDPALRDTLQYKVGSTLQEVGRGISDFADGVSPAIGTATNELLSWMDSFTSDVSRENARLVGIQNQVDSEINAAEKAANIAAGGNEYIESVREIGKNFLDAGANVLDNPTYTADVIANALGSLGPSAKVVGGISKLVTSTGTYNAAKMAAAIDNSTMAQILSFSADAAKVGAAAGAVGMTEASGTYHQTLSDVLGMPEQELLKSPEYFHLVENGMNPAAARQQVAERTAREAFFYSLPMATAASLLALKFEANPIKAMAEAGFKDGLRGVGREVLGQTLEEGLQGGISPFAQNIAERENIDKLISLTRDVGEQAATGAIAGAGMAGALSAPGFVEVASRKQEVPAETKPEAPKTELDPQMADALRYRAEQDISNIEWMVGPLTPRQNRIFEDLKDNRDNPENLYDKYVVNELSPAAQELLEESAAQAAMKDAASKVGPVVDKIKEAAPGVYDAAKTLTESVIGKGKEIYSKVSDTIVETAKDFNARQTEEAKAETVQAAESASNAVTVWQEQTGDAAPEGIKQATAPKSEDVPPELSSALKDAPDVVSTVSSLVREMTVGALKVKGLSEEGLLYANEHIEKLKSALPTMPEDVKAVVQKTLNSPVVSQIKTRVRNLDLSSKADASVSAIKRMVRLDPTRVNSKKVDDILEHREDHNLTDEDVRFLTVAQKISKALDNHEGLKTQINKGEVIDITKPINEPVRGDNRAAVSRSLQIDGFKGYGSVNDLASDILRAAQSPDGTVVDDLGEVFSGDVVVENLRNLALHQVNKVDALNRSLAAGGQNMQFESLNGKTGKMVPAGQAGGAKSVFRNPGNTEHTLTAQAVYNDMMVLVEVHNILAEAFPDMFPEGKIKPVQLSNGTEAKSEPAQPKAKPEAEATVKDEAGKIVYGDENYPKGFKTENYEINWNGPIASVVFSTPVMGVNSVALDGKKLIIKQENGIVFQVEILSGKGIDIVVTSNKKSSSGDTMTLLFAHDSVKPYVAGKGINVRNDGGHALDQISLLNGIDPELITAFMDLNVRAKDENYNDINNYIFMWDQFDVDVFSLAIAKNDWISAQDPFTAKDARHIAYQDALIKAKGETGQKDTAPKSRPVTESEADQIQEQLKAAYGDRQFPRLKITVSDVIEGKESRLGRMNHDGTMILRTDVFENKDNMKKATHILFHEFGHWVDGVNEFGVRPSESKDWNKAVIEFDAFVNNEASESQRRFLGYILSHRGKDTYNSEVFADLFSLMGTRPDFVKSKFPAAYRFMQELLDETTSKAKTEEQNEDIIKMQDGTIITKTTITALDGTVFKYGPMEDEHMKAIAQTIADVFGYNFYVFVKDGIRGFRTMTEGVPVAAMYDEESGILYFHEEIVKGFIEDKAQGLHVVFHELGHVVDSLFSIHGISKSEDFYPYESVIQREINDAVQNLDSFTSHLLTGYALQHSDREVRTAETFAELFSVFTYSPETIQKELPNVFDFFQKLVEKYSDEEYEKISRPSRQGRYRENSRTGNSSEKVKPASPDTDESVSTLVETPEFPTADPVRNELFNKVFTPSKNGQPFKSLDDLMNQVSEQGEHMNVLVSMIRDRVPGILATLNKRLQTVRFDKNKPETVIEAYRRDPEKVLRIRDYKNLGFVDPTTGKYDPVVAQLAIALVLDAMSNAHPAPPSLLTDRMEEDGIAYGELSEEHLSNYMQSISIRQLAENLGRDLPVVLGLDINGDARLGDAKGVVETTIKEILTALASGPDPLVRIVEIPVSKGFTDAVILTDTMKQFQKDMGLNGRMGVNKLVFPDSHAVATINEPPAYVAQKQNRGVVRTSDTERQAIQNMQSIGHRRTPTAGLMTALGEDLVFVMFGGTPVEHLNKKHPLRRSKEGKNLSIRMDYVDATYIAEVLEEAGPDSKIYYPVGISKVGRHGMQGPNPQNNKFLRHMVTSTWSLLDMKNNQQHKDYFWLTVAQSSGYAKVEKKNHNEVLSKVEGTFREQFRDAIYLAREYLITGELNAEAFSKAAFGTGPKPAEMSMALIDAIMAVAALDEAVATGTEDKLETSLSFEIDGLTDGPGNMLVNMGYGPLTVADYENLRRIGYFLGDKGMTTNEYYSQPGAKDLYEMTTQIAESIGVLVKVDLVQAQAMARFAARFGNYKIEDSPYGTRLYKMTRNTAKSPVTKKGYGAGAGSISRGISEEMVMEFYRYMAEETKGNVVEELSYPEFMEDYQVLFGDTFNPSQDWKHSMFDSKSMSQFKLVIKETMGKMLTEGAEQLMGQNILEMTDTLVFATNVQAEYLRLAFAKRVQDTLNNRLGKKDKGEHNIQELTVSELKKIISDLGALAPMYSNGVQTLGLGSFENVIHDKAELSSNMDGHLRMKSSLPLPAEAGVKVIPYLNIGRGDAMMMNLVYSQENFPTRSIPVYDGISLAIADIGDYSDLINEAVAENWKQDLLGPVIEDLRRFSQSVPKDEQELLQLAFNLAKRRQKKAWKIKTLSDIPVSLERMRTANMARKAVFEQIPRSVNHMAGANQSVSFGPEGSMDLDQINDLIRAEMQNPTAEKKEEEKYDPSGDFSSLNVTNAKDMLRSLLGVVKNKRLLEVLKTLQTTNPNVRVVTGNANQVAAHRADEGADPILTVRKNSGFYDASNNTIYLISKNHETLVHELVHQVTFALVHAVYKGEGTEQQRGAVKRLEDLRDQFMDMDFSKSSKRVQKAARSAKAQILEHLANKNALSKAKALNEFMAWTLANEGLQRELGTTIADGVLRLAKAVKVLMARLLGSVSYDMFSNVLFNTQAILDTEPEGNPTAVDPKTNEPPAEEQETEDAIAKRVLNELINQPPPPALPPPSGGDGNGNGGDGGNGNGGNDPSGLNHYNNFWINLLREKLNSIQTDQMLGVPRQSQYNRYERNASNAFRRMVMGHFTFTEEQRQTFMAIHMILALEVQLDARALDSMNKVFTFAVKNLRPGMFSGEADDKYQAFMDTLGKTTNDEQVSDAIATFFAMSQTNDEFRVVLDGMRHPSDPRATTLGEFASMATMILMRKAVGTLDPSDMSARAAMDVLSRVILAQDTRQEFRLLRGLMASFDAADKYMSGKLRQLAEFTGNYAYNVPDEERLKKIVAESVSFITNLLDDTRADLTLEFAKNITHNGTAFDKVVFLREFVSELVGTDRHNTDIIALLDVVKHQVDALRQSHREIVPKVLQDNFETKPTTQQWQTAHSVLGRTDFSSVFDAAQPDTSFRLISDDAYRGRQIQNFTTTINQYLPSNKARAVLQKAQQLADFMNGKGAGFELARNAYAINELYGNPLETGLVVSIDKLVTLLAIQGKTADERQMISDLYAADPDAMRKIMIYTQKLNKNEDVKLQDPRILVQDDDIDGDIDEVIARMKLNGYKGYIPNLGQPEVTITVEEDQYQDILEKRGFVRVADYTADHMASVQSKGYYVSMTRQDGGYAQGVMQSIQSTYRGVNTGTGITVNGTTSGIVMGYRKVASIQNYLSRRGTVRNVKEVLLPVYNKDREVEYYEYGLNPDIVRNFSKPLGNLALQLGVWSGRQVEEKAASSYNALLIDELKRVWDNREPGSDNLFIDIRKEYQNWMAWSVATDAERETMNRPDPIYADSWKVIPPETKAYIIATFGEDGFMVRRGDVNTALGYAEPSIADFWTGKTRFSEGTQQVVQAVANMTLGRLKDGTSGLTLLQTGAGVVQETVAQAKDWIITRSLVIPLLNSQANVISLNMRGVPNNMILKGYRDKLIEIESYNENFQKIQFLQMEHDLAIGDQNKQKIINDQIQVLKDQNRRMSIHPLIEAGVYKTISEGLTEEDFELMRNGLSALMEKKISKLPDLAKTVVNHGLLSQNTTIYKLANKSVQYGDFLAKAVYYDYLTTVKHLDDDKALALINEEFVNFSPPPGRVRAALEKNGLTWFLTYKIRVTKIAMAQARKNPVRALLVNSLDPGHNTAAHSNLLATMADGSFDYSLGWGMLFAAPGLNPWANLMDW